MPLSLGILLLYVAPESVYFIAHIYLDQSFLEKSFVPNECLILSLVIIACCFWVPFTGHSCASNFIVCIIILLVISFLGYFAFEVLF